MRTLLIPALLSLTLMATAAVGEEVSVDCVLHSEHLLVPARPVFESLGAIVAWLPEDRAVKVTSRDSVAVVSVDNTQAFVNGKPVEMKAPAVNRNERVVVPLRFVAEALGAQVDYQGDRVLLTPATGPEVLLVITSCVVVSPRARTAFGGGGGCSSCGR